METGKRLVPLTVIIGLDGVARESSPSLGDAGFALEERMMLAPCSAADWIHVRYMRSLCVLNRLCFRECVRLHLCKSLGAVHGQTCVQI